MRVDAKLPILIYLSKIDSVECVVLDLEGYAHSSVEPEIEDNDDATGGETVAIARSSRRASDTRFTFPVLCSA